MPKKAALGQDELFLLISWLSMGRALFCLQKQFAIDDCPMDHLSAHATGDPNRGPTLVIVIWILTVLALIVVSIKIYTRITIIREPALDDFFTGLAVVCSLMADMFLNGLNGKPFG